MPKRFIDTLKYKKRFIRNLPSAYKIFWDYLCLNCDNAGVWHVDFDVACVETGEKLKEEKAITLLKDKILVFDNGAKWFLIDFVDFQYNCKIEDLNTKNNAHASVLKTLQKYNIPQLLASRVNGKIEPPISPSRGAKDKDMEVDMDKVMDTDKDKGAVSKISGDFINQLITAFCEVYQKARQTDYVIVNEGQERKAMGALLQAYKVKNKGSTSEKTLADFRGLFTAICSHPYKTEYLNGITISMISSNLMKYVAEITNPKNKANDWNYIFS